MRPGCARAMLDHGETRVPNHCTGADLGVVLPDAARTSGPPASRLSLSEPCQAVAAAAGCTVPRRGKCRGFVEKLSGKHAALSVVKGSESPAFVIATRPHAFQTVSENEAAARQTRPHALEFASRKLARRSPCQRATSSVKGPGIPAEKPGAVQEPHDALPHSIPTQDCDAVGAAKDAVKNAVKNATRGGVRGLACALAVNQPQLKNECNWCHGCRRRRLGGCWTCLSDVDARI